jgi:hypothetical protein
MPLPDPELVLELSVEDAFGELAGCLPASNRSKVLSIPITELQKWCKTVLEDETLSPTVAKVMKDNFVSYAGKRFREEDTEETEDEGVPSDGSGPETRDENYRNDQGQAARGEGGIRRSERLNRVKRDET